MSEAPDQSPSSQIDHVLHQVDPEFLAGLEAVRAVENAADVHIEASVLDLDGAEGEEAPGRADQPSRLPSLKELPKEVLGYLLAQVRHLLHAFKVATFARKLLMLALVVILAAVTYLLRASLRGTWIPGLNQPILTGFAKYADTVETIDPHEEQVSLTTEFPPDVHEFLFKPFKVNLRATAENPQPMGAFEFVVTLDAKEAAIEARDREVEMVDLIQRVFEDETFHDLATELGKGRLKSRILREVNTKLSTGRVTDVHFKTFVLKP